MKTKTIWVHSGGSCPACSAMKGTEYDENPGDVTLHPNCGCTADPVEIEVEEEDLEFDATGRMINPSESEEKKVKRIFGKTVVVEDIKKMKNDFEFHRAVAKTSAFEGGYNDLKNKEKVSLYEKFKNTIGKDKYEKEKNFNENLSEEERTIAILKNKPLSLTVRKNPKANGWIGISFLGNNAVLNYGEKIEKYSKKHKVDPDLVKAIIFTEHSRGHKYGLDIIADYLDKSTSRRPMNIQKKWIKLIDNNEESWYNEDKNIEAGIILINRLYKAIENPTAEKVGILWNGTWKNKVSDFGNYVGKQYEKKEWKVWEKKFRKKRKEK